MGKDTRRGEGRPMILGYGVAEVSFLAFLTLLVVGSLVSLGILIYRWFRGKHK